MKKTWKIQVECVYRMDREERLRQAYEIVVPDPIFNVTRHEEEEFAHEKRKDCPICESIQPAAKSGTDD
jgi:hypothetical protein